MMLLKLYKKDILVKKNVKGFRKNKKIKAIKQNIQY